MCVHKHTYNVTICIFWLDSWVLVHCPLCLAVTIQECPLLSFLYSRWRPLQRQIYLVPSKCSICIFWTNEWMDEQLPNLGLLQSCLFKPRKCFCLGLKLRVGVGVGASILKCRLGSCVWGPCRTQGWFARRGDQEPGRAWRGFTRKGHSKNINWWKREEISVQDIRLRLEIGRNKFLHWIQWAGTAAIDGHGTRNRERRKPAGQRKQ